MRRPWYEVYERAADRGARWRPAGYFCECRSGPDPDYQAGHRIGSWLELAERIGRWW